MPRALALAVLGSLLLLQACEAPPRDPAAGASTTPELEARLAQARQRLDGEHVVFSEPSMLIERLGVPLAPPVTVGSRPALATLASDDPGVVSVEEDGRLLAHRAGRTLLRAVGSSSVLAVVVVPPGPGAAAEVRP